MTQRLVLLHGRRSALESPHLSIGAYPSSEFAGADELSSRVCPTRFTSGTDMAGDPTTTLLCSGDTTERIESPSGDPASIDLVLENLYVAPHN